MSVRSRAFENRGASLVETLVAIGVIGILFSLVFPALMRSRAAGGEAKSLVNARDIGVLLDIHATSNRGFFAACRAHEEYLTNLYDDNVRVSFNSEAAARWNTRLYWWSVIATTADGAAHWQTWVSPGADVTPQNFRTPHYAFSNSFVASPRLWRRDFDGSATALQDVNVSHVRHPSQKAMVWDAVIAYVHESARPRAGAGAVPMPIAFADLHGEARRYADASPAVVNILNDEEWRDRKLHNTESGVEGRDY